MVEGNQYGAGIIRIKDADRPIVLKKSSFNRCQFRPLKSLYPVGQTLPGQSERIALNNEILVNWVDLGLTTRTNDQLIIDDPNTYISDA